MEVYADVYTLRPSVQTRGERIRRGSDLMAPFSNHTHTHTRRNCELIVRIFAHLMVLQDRVEVHFNPAFAQYSDVYKHSQTSTYSIAVVAQMKIPARNPRNTDRAYENRLRCAQRESTWGLYRRYTLARLPRHSPAQGRRARPGVGNVYLFVRCV